jgi:hypothetical protein
MIKLSRAAVANTLALGGVVIILLVALEIVESRMQLGLVIAGIIINQIGVWGLAGRLLPERRSFLQLRREADRFIDMVRQLNSQAVQGDEAGVEQTKTAMYGLVDRMAEVAAIESDD